MQSILLDITVMVAVATAIAYILKLLKQPLIPAYIIAGALIGPAGLSIVSDMSIIQSLAEIGIAFLLFVVGLELDLKKLKETGLVAAFGGITDVLVLSSIGFLIALSFSIFSVADAAYIGLAVAFSSTMVVVKLLSDKKEVSTLHGRISIGILLVQDVLAVIALSVLGTLNSFSPYVIAAALGKVALIVAIAAVCARFIFPPIVRAAADSQELLFLISIALCLGFAMGAAWLGFSIAIGAFAAGIALANLPYNFEIIAKVKPLRDFFATLFFVTLGMGLVWQSLASIALPIAVFTVFVVVGNILKNMVFCRLFGYSSKTSFLTGLYLAQVSEFSLILVMQGIAMGHVSQEVLTFTVSLAVITMSITPYLMKYDLAIFIKCRGILSIFSSIGSARREMVLSQNEGLHFNALVLGADRTGHSIVKALRRMKKEVLVIDYNPDIINRLKREGIQAMYGDIGDPDIISRMNLEDVEVVVSTVPDLADNTFIIHSLKAKNRRAVAFVAASKVEDALELYSRGADYVILPHFLGGEHASLILQSTERDIGKLIRTKLHHIEELKERRMLGHLAETHNGN